MFEKISTEKKLILGFCVLVIACTLCNDCMMCKWVPKLGAFRFPKEHFAVAAKPAMDASKKQSSRPANIAPVVNATKSNVPEPAKPNVMETKKPILAEAPKPDLMDKIKPILPEPPKRDVMEKKPVDNRIPVADSDSDVYPVDNTQMIRKDLLTQLSEYNDQFNRFQTQMKRIEQDKKKIETNIISIQKKLLQHENDHQSLKKQIGKNLTDLQQMDQQYLAILTEQRKVNKQILDINMKLRQYGGK